MPRNRFPLPVRVGRQIDMVGCRCSFGYGIDMFAIASDDFILHRKVIFGIDRTCFRD